jgi:tRNA A37 methylthiotransferase MiaB
VNFVSSAHLDAIGVFGYSDEDNTEALGLENKVDPDLIRERVENLASIVDELVSERAGVRIGQEVSVLIEDAELQEGRAEHQGPEVDGTTSFIGTSFRVGEYVRARISDAMGADLIAEAL